MKTDYKVGDLVKIINLPNEDDPFNGLTAKVTRILDGNDLFYQPGLGVFEIEVIDKTSLFETCDDWGDLGMGIVFASEMEPVQ